MKFIAIPTQDARTLQHGGPDAYGQIPQRMISDGVGNPCRHCLTSIPEGEELLVLAYRPFPDLQPYAETGPIFLCGKECARHEESSDVPEMFQAYENILLRGYSADHRIVYGTGQITSGPQIRQTAQAIFENERVAYIHMRSATNNCYQGCVIRE